MSRPDQADHGLAHVASQHSVPEMLGRLETLAQSRGLTIFARIDFSGDAQKVGLTMRPTQLLIFRQSQGRHAVDDCLAQHRD